MATYVLLFSGGGMPDDEAQQKAVMQEWMSWFGMLGSNLVDQGNPFNPMAMSISSDGKVSNGSVGGMASGYSIIKANSMDEAVSRAKTCPVLKSGARITVYETVNAM